MIPNTNDGSRSMPYLRRDLGMACLFGLPAWSRAPALDDPELGPKLVQAGYAGVQLLDIPPPQNTRGLALTGLARANDPAAIRAIAESHQQAGLQCTTLQLGSGLDDDEHAWRLIDSLLDAAGSLRYPLYLETHRASITQDIWRTCRHVEKFPELRFNGDLSHWYTGHEMGNGSFEEALAYLKPVLSRVRFLHGRIGDAGCIQMALAGREQDPFVTHFETLWTEVFVQFLGSAAAGDFLSFTLELLPARAVHQGRPLYVGYARERLRDDGVPEEESDRWVDAERVWAIAEACFARAQAQVASGSQ